MRGPVVFVVALGLVGSSAALAQSSPPSGAQPPGSQGKPGSSGIQAAPASGQNGLITRQKLTQDLQNAGFSDVKIVQEAFVVQAKTRDGNPIVMTIGPNGMSAFETVSNGPASTGSTRIPGSPSTSPNASGGVAQRK